MLGDNDHVSYLYLAACVSHHRTAAGRTVENRGYFVGRTGTFSIDDRASGNQSSASRYDHIALGGIVVEDSIRTRRTRPLLAAPRRRSSVSAAGGIGVRSASHRSTVHDSDAKLVLIHIDHPDRIVRNRAVCIGRLLQHSLDVLIADVH